MASQAPSPNTLDGVVREMHVVKGTQIQMAQALQQNTKAFADAFQMTDCHIHVMQRAMNDLLLDRVYRSGDGGVDFAEYMAEYWGVIGVILFIEGLKDLAGPEEALITSPDEEVVVFGG
jgi:hypothetical protein